MRLDLCVDPSGIFADGAADEQAVRMGIDERSDGIDLQLVRTSLTPA